MEAARQKRRRKRTKKREEERKAKGLERANKHKRARVDDGTSREEQKGDTTTAADTEQDGAEPDEDEDDGVDSEEDAADLPAHWPFSFRFFIDDGELRDGSAYSQLVRDRDFIDAELMVEVAGCTEKRVRVPLLEYVAEEAALMEDEDAHADEGGDEGEEKGVNADGTRTRHSPLSASLRTSRHIAQQAPRNRLASASRPIASTTTSTPAATTTTAVATNGKTTAPSTPATATSTTAATTTDGTAKNQAQTAAQPTQVNLMCISRGCQKPATLGPCPHCVTVGVENSYFCSQKCYKDNWQDHCAMYHPATAS